MGQNGRAPAKREWAVEGPLDFERTYPEGHALEGQHVRLPVDPASVEAMAADVANVIVMVGGTALMAADRMVDPFTSLWITTAVYWQWSSYAPSSSAPAPAPRGKRGGKQEPTAPRSETAQAAAAERELTRSEFQQPEPEPQEPDEDERDPEEFKELSPQEQALVDAELAEEPV